MYSYVCNGGIQFEMKKTHFNTVCCILDFKEIAKKN